MTIIFIITTTTNTNTIITTIIIIFFFFFIITITTIMITIIIILSVEQVHEDSRYRRTCCEVGCRGPPGFVPYTPHPLTGTPGSAASGETTQRTRRQGADRARSMENTVHLCSKVNA